MQGLMRGGKVNHSSTSIDPVSHFTELICLRLSK